MLILVWFERSLPLTQIRGQCCSRSLKDDVTSGRTDVNPHGRQPASKLSYLGKRSEPRKNARARGRGSFHSPRGELARRLHGRLRAVQGQMG